MSASRRPDRQSWTLERSALLIAYWHAGWPFSRIAPMLAVSRSACCGRMHRLRGYRKPYIYSYQPKPWHPDTPTPSRWTEHHLTQPWKDRHK